MRKFPLTAIAILAGIWLVLGVVIYVVRHAKPTPASVQAYVEKHDLTGKSEAERQATIEKLARQLNQLTFEENRDLRTKRQLEPILKQLTPAELDRFLDLTLPSGYKQMMEAFNRMDPAKRKAFVAKTLEQMKQRGDADAPASDDPRMQKIVDAGLRSFYSDANAETKLDLAPIIEQMQKNMRGLR